MPYKLYLDSLEVGGPCANARLISTKYKIFYFVNGFLIANIPHESNHRMILFLCDIYQSMDCNSNGIRNPTVYSLKKS